MQRPMVADRIWNLIRKERTAVLVRVGREGRARRAPDGLPAEPLRRQAVVLDLQTLGQAAADHGRQPGAGFLCPSKGGPLRRDFRARTPHRESGEGDGALERRPAGPVPQGRDEGKSASTRSAWIARVWTRPASRVTYAFADLRARLTGRAANDRRSSTRRRLNSPRPPPFLTARWQQASTKPISLSTEQDEVLNE
jgi:hypothetical protein